MDVPDNMAIWAESLLRTMLDGWLDAATQTNGLFHPCLNRQWGRIEARQRTLVTQCRPIYNFCRGYEAFQDHRYADAAYTGLTALRTYFQQASGRYRWAVTEDGAEADATLDAYGYAFCILAQATAARTFSSSALAATAMETWQGLSDVFTDRHGGLMWKVNAQSSRDAGVRSQNPMMHVFEALMALYRVERGEKALSAGADLLRFVGALADFPSGTLIEMFDADWQPLPSDQGGVVNLGHAFEWAYLLSDWYALAPDPAILSLGERFLHTGMEWGWDADGGIRESADSQGQVLAEAKGLWQQCEAIRALSRYVRRHGQTHLIAPLQRSLDFFQRHFVDPEYGGVYVSPAGLGQPISLDKGNAWKLDYHTVNMCLELMGGNVAGSSTLLTPTG